LSGSELVVACKPEAGPSFHRVQYVDSENEEILAEIIISRKQESSAPSAKKPKTSTTIVGANDMPVVNVPVEALKGAKSSHSEKLRDIEMRNKQHVGKALSAGSFESTLQQAIHTGDKQLLSQCLKSNQQGNFITTLSKLEPKFVVPLMRILVSMLKSSAYSPALFSYLSILVQRNTALLLASGALPECTSLHSTLDARLSYFKELSKLQGRLGLLLDHIKQNDQVVEVDSEPKNVFDEDKPQKNGKDNKAGDNASEESDAVEDESDGDDEAASDGEGGGDVDDRMSDEGDATDNNEDGSGEDDSEMTSEEEKPAKALSKHKQAIKPPPKTKQDAERKVEIKNNVPKKHKPQK
jgi:hypothetical protein